MLIGLNVKRSRLLLRLSPVVIADSLSPFFKEANKSWIFTSATLSVAEKFDHARNALGLEDDPEYRFESPF